MGPRSDRWEVVDGRGSMSTEEEDGAVPEWPDLSPWFNPFLPHFVRETERTGGRVRWVTERERLSAIVLDDPTERVSSIFSRSPGLARGLVAARGTWSAYSDFLFDGPHEAYRVYSISLTGSPSLHRFRHRVRPVGEPDIARVVDLVQEVHGRVDPRWFRSAPDSPETGFVVEVGPRLAGVGWVAVAGRSARLHSLAVRPAYRRLGIGSDLLFARLLWAASAGATEALSEIAEGNRPSCSVAEAGGMHSVGELYLYPPVSGPPVA